MQTGEIQFKDKVSGTVHFQKEWNKNSVIPIEENFTEKSSFSLENISEAKKSQKIATLV